MHARTGNPTGVLLIYIYIYNVLSNQTLAHWNNNKIVAEVIFQVKNQGVYIC